MVAQARFGFSGHRLKIIGVTGTTGKTVTAHYIASILEKNGCKVGVVSRANIRINNETVANVEDVTATPFRLHRQLRNMRKQGVDWVVLEVTSDCLKDKRIWGVPIRVAVMTNLSSAHLTSEETLEDYAATKAQLLSMAQKAVVLNRDDEWYEYFLRTPKQAVYDYGASEDAAVRIDRHKFKSEVSHVRLRYGERVVNVTLGLPGETMAYCALAAATTAYGLDIAWQHVRGGLESVKSVSGRVEVIRQEQSFGIMIDYAQTPGAFAKTLQDMESVTDKKLIAVLQSSQLAQYKEVAQSLSDKVVEIGADLSNLRDVFDMAGSGDRVVILGDSFWRESHVSEEVNRLLGSV